MTARRARVCCSALIALGMLALVPPVRAQEGADKVYRDGVDAIEKQKWPEAAGFMRQAIGMNRTEAPGARRLGLFGGRDYLPHLLLGRALFAQSDCTGALNAWEESDNQGVARKIRNGEYAKEIQRGYDQCEAKGFLPAPKFQKEVDDTKAALRAAYDEGRRLTDHVAPYDESIKAAFRKQVATADSRMQTASEKLTSGERTRRAQDLVDSRAAAVVALREYQVSRPPLDALIASVAGFLNKANAAEKELAGVEAKGRELEALLRGSPVKVSPSEATSSARARADAQVASARDKIKTARTTQNDATLAEAAGLAVSADKTYLQARNEIEALIKAGVDRDLQLAQTQMQNTLTGLDARASDIAAALGNQPAPGKNAKDFEAAQRGLDRARQAFDRAMRARDLVAARAAVQLTPRLASQLDALAAALAVEAPALPGALRAAAQAFFDGSYTDAVRLLPADQVAAIDQRFRIHGHVVRAAALFALYQRTGGTDASLRDQAQQEVQQSHALDPSFQPNPSAFSPRFLAFFRGAGSAQ
jgi:hypothetical protein